ncbi:JAB domain-containing protein [Roseivirga sp. BDSF3-8]|uniref:JAB domain-containing protein n=1 Tax=Roseivirga sp. BDSF3-8 TaxID=3241598 RepID=UPI003531FFA7
MEVNDLYNVAEIRLTYLNHFSPDDLPQVRNSKDAYEILLQCWEVGKIELVMQSKLLLLNQKCKVLGIVNIASGSVCKVPIDLKQIFAATLKSGATAIIAAHNHPSGDITPGVLAKDFAQKLKRGADLLDIRLLDYLIISPEDYYSFCDRELLEGYNSTSPLDN